MRRYLGLVVTAAAALQFVETSAAVNIVADVEVYAGDHAKHHEGKRMQLRAVIPTHSETATTRTTTTGPERSGVVVLDADVPWSNQASEPPGSSSTKPPEFESKRLQSSVEAHPPMNRDNNQGEAVNYDEKEDEDEEKIGRYCTKIAGEDGDWYDCDQESEGFQDSSIYHTAASEDDSSNPESAASEDEATETNDATTEGYTSATESGAPTPAPTKPGESTPSPTQPGDPTSAPTKPGESTPTPMKPGDSTPAPTQPGEPTPAAKPDPTPAATTTATTNSGSSTGTTGTTTGGTTAAGGTTTTGGSTISGGTSSGDTTNVNVGTSDTIAPDTTANTSGTSVTETTTTSGGRAILSTGSVAGIIIGCAVFAAIVVGAVLFRQKSLARQREENLFADLGGGGLETDYAAM